MRTAAVIVVLAICLCLAASAADVIRPTADVVRPNNLQLANAQVLTRLNRSDILRNLNKDVTIEGYYYDGSIPMILDRFDRIASDERLPKDAYVPLVGTAPTGVKWGDRVRITGRAEQPSWGDPHVRNEPVVIRMPQAQQVQILQPSQLTVKKPGIDLSRIRIRPVLAGTSYAVLIAGGIGWADNHLRYWNDLKTMYKILKASGYDPTKIYVIYADGFARDTEMPVNYSATKANIAAVFNLLGSGMTEGDTLYIMMNDHGGPGTGDPNGDETITHRDEVLCLWDNIDMTDDEFATELNKVKKYSRIIIQMKQCYSGGFVDDLTRPNCIIMASSAPNQVSWAHPPAYQYGEFTHWYFTALTGDRPDKGDPVPSANKNGDGMISFMEAFNFAREHDVQPETPQYEDNGTKPCASGVMPAAGEGELGAGCAL